MAGLLAQGQRVWGHRICPAAEQLVQGQLPVCHGRLQLLQQRQHGLPLIPLNQEPVEGQGTVAEGVCLGLKCFICFLNVQPVFQLGEIILQHLLQGMQERFLLGIHNPQPLIQGREQVWVWMHRALLNFTQVGRHTQAITDGFLLHPLAEPLHTQNCACQ